MMQNPYGTPTPANNNLIIINHDADASNMGMGDQTTLDQVNKVIMDVNIAQSFGAFFFNTQDPYYIEHKNTPKKVPNSDHWVSLGVNLYFFVSLAVGAALLALRLITSNPILIPAVIMAQGWLVYIIASFCWSHTLGFLNNVKPFTLYQQTYDNMVKSAPLFRFHIECYHYETRRSSKGRTTRVRVTTHRASQEYHPRGWVDESGALGEIIDDKDYIFLKCNPRFYFGNPQAESSMKQAYNNFLMHNTRDAYQDKSNNFIIPGFEEEIGFNARGEAPHTLPLFYVLTLFGFGYPYCRFLENFVSRYELNILKNITA